VRATYEDLILRSRKVNVEVNLEFEPKLDVSVTAVNEWMRRIAEHGKLRRCSFL